MVLHEWLAFYSVFCCCFLISTKVVYLQHWHGWCQIKLQLSQRKFCVHHTNHAPCHFVQSHIRKVYACLAVTCQLHFWQNDWDLLCANVVNGGGMDTEIRVSTENRPWRRKFSCHSCRDSNPWPFNHESGILTTELSPPPGQCLPGPD